MNKKSKMLALTMGLTGVMSFALILNVNSLPSNLYTGATSTITYKHYNAIAETENGHGCVEFWVSCSDYSYSLTAPTEGNIVEGGDITDNPSFDWDGMDYLDKRYIPSINKQKEWGMIPVLDLGNNKITYGLFPQTVVADNDLINILNALPSSSIDETTGYYYYNGKFYQTAIGDRCDSDSHFANGTKVVDGTKYWFVCERISWVIMENSGSTYQMYSEKALHAGINWGYSNSNLYEQSQVREWLNGIGEHAGNGFFQTGLFNSNKYVQTMSFTVDDGSSTLNDNVRLLTKGEAGEDSEDSPYFANNDARKVAPTDWTAAHHACFQSGSTSFTRWWLCEANTDNTANAWGVGLGGAVGNGGPKTASGSNDRAERPVITITIE